MLQSQIEVAEYIRAIATELAKLAHDKKLNTIGFCLEMVVADAEEAVAKKHRGRT